jgi:nucleoside-diphosphate kinase
MERTLILAKPDAVQRGLVGEIIARVERRGLKIVGLKLIKLSNELAEAHYQEHRDKAFFQSLIDYITWCPIAAMVVEGPQAIELVRSTIGSTSPVDAAPGSIRGDLGVSVSRNLVHASDGPVSAEREIRLFFKPDELFQYKRVADLWMLGT